MPWPACGAGFTPWQLRVSLSCAVDSFPDCALECLVSLGVRGMLLCLVLERGRGLGGPRNCSLLERPSK